MSNPDPQALGTAIGVAVAAQLADRQLQAEQAEQQQRQQRIDAAAAGIVDALMPGASPASATPVPSAPASGTTTDAAAMLAEAKAFIASAEANPDVTFDAGHLKMFLEIKFSDASAEEIEAVIVAAEGS